MAGFFFGVSLRAGLSVASPRSFLAVGFPLQSLTRAIPLICYKHYRKIPILENQLIIQKWKTGLQP
jgi:hypothetical protein